MKQSTEILRGRIRELIFVEMNRDISFFGAKIARRSIRRTPGLVTEGISAAIFAKNALTARRGASNPCLASRFAATRHNIASDDISASRLCRVCLSDALRRCTSRYSPLRDANAKTNIKATRGERCFQCTPFRKRTKTQPSVSELISIVNALTREDVQHLFTIDALISNETPKRDSQVRVSNINVCL